ncbi:DUF6660 family protein [Pedobacter frigiditerrae]|uniref:DUF6660 family protein n=1 Tax=Pedobacter frigiditerrae TaxID=2530452 RepID=UPI00397729E8
MKYLAIIFCLYMTMLTLLPCQDREDFTDGKVSKSSVQKTAKGVEHYGQETCPPFCTCSCCSVSRDFIQSKADKVIVYHIEIPYGEYQMPAIAEQPLDIYQPPQIS